MIRLDGDELLETSAWSPGEILSAVASSLVGGVGRDAGRIAERIAARVPAEEGLPAAR